MALEATVHVAKGLAQIGIDDHIHQHIVPVVRTAVEDRSCRARQAIAKDFADLTSAVLGDGGQRSMEVLQHDLLPSFVALLKDNEADDRLTSSTSFA
eukprot:22244-Eustigmatos_ZCMA.PRE.1